MKSLFTKIKKHITVIGFTTAGLSLLATTACQDQLQTKIYSQISPDNFYRTESDFNVAVVTLYSPFGTDWGATDVGDGVYYPNLYNANYRTYVMRSMLTTDELENDNPSNQELFNWGPSTWAEPDEPYGRIRFVARATSTIDNMTKSTSVPDAIKGNYIAQAKTLRAWMMYLLYDYYGPVNAKTDPATLTSTEILPRPSDTDYTAQIEKDLTESIPDLTDKFNNDASNWGRMSKGVARMLLLKLYMHTKQWDKAETVGKDILGMGYALEPVYADIFKKQLNNEIIFAIDCDIATGSRNWYPQHLFPADYDSASVGGTSIVRGAGWYTDRMPWAFYDKFEPSDLRKKTTIIDTYYDNAKNVRNRANGLMKGPIPLKYTGIVNGRAAEKYGQQAYADDWVIFRLGEVYLSVAEAINEQRGPGDAYTFVNAVRARAGVSNFSGMTKETFRDAILDERGRELFSEGVRRQDLIRHGKFISEAQARGRDAKDYEVLFPIPNTVIMEGKGIIKQNPGYVE